METANVPNAYDVLAAHLRAARKKLQKTPAEMAVYLGMSRGAYSCAESGVAPGLDKLVGIANTLDMTLDDLLGRTNTRGITRKRA